MELFKKLLICLGSILLCSEAGFGQSTFPARGFSPILDGSEAEKKLNTFRKTFFTEHDKTIYHQAYLYRFHFIKYPKSGQSVIHRGMFSGPYPNSSLIRIDLFALGHETVPEASFLLFRDQNNSKVWNFKKTNKVIKEVHPKDWLSPWKKELNHAPFDLLMPFLAWPFEYEKSGKVCGRPAHLYNFIPPQNSLTYPVPLESVRLSIDDTYYAPLRIEYMDGGILPARVFSLQSFKKVDDRWVVKAIDSKDRDSGSRTRLELLSVAHGLDLQQSFFTTDGLTQPINQSSISFIPL